MALPTIVIATLNDAHVPNLMPFYACNQDLSSMLQNGQYAAYMQQHAAASWVFHTRAILNSFDLQKDII